MKNKSNNFVYIDGANLYKGLESSGWAMDYGRFRVWLTEKYGIKHAYIFIGLIPKYKDLYKYLQESGFTLVFKEVIYDGNGKPKGNCDADLVLQAACDAYENKFEKAIVVSSDGDYAGLIKFLSERGKLEIILSPHAKNLCSILLKRTGAPIAYLNDQKIILQSQKEKAPGADGTAQGSFS
ncbi:NYN domain-containing protein [Candidatus Giovannonibacteria bacterium]|nr:NYN domain-containing protein [Candidatus Giovannonibacteria bacterium]